MIDIETDEDFALVQFTLDGRVDKAEFERVIATFEDMISRHKKVHVIEVLKNFDGMDSELWWRDFKWSFDHIADFGRCAVVTDKGWVGPIARFAGAVMAIQLRVFPPDQMVDARAWARTG